MTTLGLNTLRLRQTVSVAPERSGALQGTTLLIDVTCICYRSLFASIAERSTVEPDQIQAFVLERFFSTLRYLSELYRARRYVFCFDDGKASLRREVYPSYKHARKERVKSDEEIHAIRETGKVIQMLRDGALANIGFGNICWQHGLEADDVMAMCASTFDHERLVMVSDDADMFQCLRTHVAMYRPSRGKTYTLRDFLADYDIEPAQWIRVKALAGCKSDNVEGIDGIGEKTAIAYIKGTMPQKGKRWDTLTSMEGARILDRNWDLVCLPHAKTEPITYKPDKVDVDALMRLFDEYALKLLRDQGEEWNGLNTGNW